jgi:photosystem II stability/assembly factor-like uncharacterized protein
VTGITAHLTRLFLIFLAGAAEFTGCAAPPTLQWHPFQEGLRSHTPVTALAFHPSRPEIVLAAAYDLTGAYRSEDGGFTWKNSGQGLEGQPALTLLTASHHPDLFLIGTMDGLYRTTDAGRTWQPTLGLPWPMTVYTIVSDDTGTFYAAGDRVQIYMSADEGQTWQPIAAIPERAAILTLFVSPDGALFLAGTDGQGLWMSLDRGRSWQMIEEIGRTFVAKLWAAPDTPTMLFARTRKGLFRSRDGGQTWHPVNVGTDARLDAVAFDPDGQHVYVATADGQLRRSPLDDDMWQPWGQGIGRGGLIFTLLFMPGSPRVLWAGTETGLYRSNNGGLTWQPLMKGPGSPSGTAMAAAKDGQFFLANLDGIYHLLDTEATWEPADAGLPREGILALIAAADRLYAGTNGHGVYRSDNYGGWWVPAGLEGLSVPALVADPRDPDHLYVRVAFERVYETTNGGQSWTARWTGMRLNTEVISLAIDPQRPEILYAGSTDGLFRSRDGAYTWERIAPELSGQTVFEVALDPRNPDQVFIGATRGVYRSLDGGISWEGPGRGLEEITVTALAFHPQRAEVLYAGTKYHGVYRSADRGQTWMPAREGLGEMGVNDLAVTPNGPYVFAATPRGVFRAEAR